MTRPSSSSESLAGRSAAGSCSGYHPKVAPGNSLCEMPSSSQVGLTGWAWTWVTSIGALLLTGTPLQLSEHSVRDPHRLQAMAMETSPPPHRCSSCAGTLGVKIRVSSKCSSCPARRYTKCKVQHLKIESVGVHECW